MSSSLIIDNIGLLVTNDLTLGDGPLGERRNAYLVIEDDRVVAVGDNATAPAADSRLDANDRGDGRTSRPVCLKAFSSSPSWGESVTLWAW